MAAGGPQARQALQVGCGGERLAKRRAATPGLLGEEVEERVLPSRAGVLEQLEGELGLLLLRAGEAERGRVGSDRGVVEQALVDVADLLDAEGAEAERTALAAAEDVDLERLQGVEDVQDGPV